MTHPRFPHWWVKYDRQVESDVSEEVEIEGVPLMARGLTNPAKTLRWEWGSEYLEGYILDGNWEESLTLKRYGWVVGFNKAGLEEQPRYGGFWFAAGEAPTLVLAVRSMQSAALRADKLCRTY